MFCTSTHKTDWIFENIGALQTRRTTANSEFIAKYKPVLHEGEERAFLTTEEEETLLSIVQETAVKFGEEFQPPLYPSVRWTAFAYYKRFFLSRSSLEFSPKHVMTACYYVATKTDEFYVPVDEFVQNLKSGTPESNIASILCLEPEVMRRMNYSLVVHTPYRPLEGLFLEMKIKMVLLNFDVESLRSAANDFLTKSLLSDALLLYCPSQLAMAAIKSALSAQGRSLEIMTEFLMKFFGVDDSEWNRNEKEMDKINKLNTRLDEIIDLVAKQSQFVQQESRESCMKRYQDFIQLSPTLEERLQAILPPKQPKGDSFDSDDDF